MVLDVTAGVWLVTLTVIIGLFALDLGLAIARPHAVGFREAAIWSIFYIAVAVVFGVIFAIWAGGDFGAQYFSGYIVEKTLSIDNLFVFVIIMSAFAVPPKYQQKLLILGIALALVMRAIFIAIGATLLAYFSFMFLLFGLLLIYTGFALYKHRDEDPEVSDNILVTATKKVLTTTDDYVDGKFFTRISGKLAATPMFIAFVAIGTTDLLFALDSIPAVFGVTSEPYIVFVANAFALLGLRALFFLVKGLLDRLVYLSIGLAIILVFIGVKLVLHWAHGIWSEVPEVSTALSLVIIVVVLTVTTIASIVAVKKDPERVARAGSVRGHQSADDLAVQDDPLSSDEA
ncbi:MAG: tellurium resistance protein TerC [Micrococcales bacterium]|nr:tellurium resistance protein TerC [Micrococcales bacterium]